MIVRLDERAGKPIVQIAPPLVRTAEELSTLVDRIGEVLAAAATALTARPMAAI